MAASAARLRHTSQMKIGTTSRPCAKVSERHQICAIELAVSQYRASRTASNSTNSGPAVRHDPALRRDSATGMEDAGLNIALNFLVV
jgi:hypothetical protein